MIAKSLTLKFGIFLDHNACRVGNNLIRRARLLEGRAGKEFEVGSTEKYQLTTRYPSWELYARCSSPWLHICM